MVVSVLTIPKCYFYWPKLALVELGFIAFFFGLGQSIEPVLGDYLADKEWVVYNSLSYCRRNRFCGYVIFIISEETGNGILFKHSNWFGNFKFEGSIGSA
jgi:hypothetical protein